MIIELKPEQEALLARAAKAGMSESDVLNQAFAVIASQIDAGDWMLEKRYAINSLIEERIGQAERGELIEAGRAEEVLRARHAERRSS